MAMASFIRSACSACSNSCAISASSCGAPLAAYTSRSMNYCGNCKTQIFTTFPRGCRSELSYGTAATNASAGSWQPLLALQWDMPRSMWRYPLTPASTSRCAMAQWSFVSTPLKTKADNNQHEIFGHITHKLVWEQLGQLRKVRRDRLSFVSREQFGRTTPREEPRARGTKCAI